MVVVVGFVYFQCFGRIKTKMGSSLVEKTPFHEVKLSFHSCQVTVITTLFAGLHRSVSSNADFPKCSQTKLRRFTSSNLFWILLSATLVVSGCWPKLQPLLTEILKLDPFSHKLIMD